MAKEADSSGVCVLMPVRNASGTVGVAVRSTLRALPENGSLLVTDDGSTDATPDVLAGFTDPRLKVYRNEQSQGVASTLNGLLKRATTSHVSRMDADDITLPHRFRAQKQHIRHGCELTFSTVFNFGDSARGWKPGIPIAISPAAMPLFLLVGNPVGHSAMYGSTEALRAVSGYVPGPAEDYELWMRLAVAGYRLRRTPLPLVAYRHHSSQMTNDADWRTKFSSDPNLRSTHRALADSLGWKGPDFFDLVVNKVRTRRDRRTLQELTRYLKDRCTAISAIETKHLEHQLAKLSR
jgi:glycosyltransferase involved in cell wall biosynthesis